MNAQLDPRLMSLLLLILVAAVKARDRAAALAAPDVRGSKTCDAPNDYLAPELAAIPQLEPSLTQHARAAALLSVGVAVPFALFGRTFKRSSDRIKIVRARSHSFHLTRRRRKHGKT